MMPEAKSHIFLNSWCHKYTINTPMRILEINGLFSICKGRIKINGRNKNGKRRRERSLTTKERRRNCLEERSRSDVA